MTDIRDACVAAGLNESLGRSCTDENLCAECWMEQDIKHHPDLYEALAG